MLTLGAKQQENLTKIWGGEVNKQTDIVKDGLKKQSDEYSKYGAKIQKELERETRDYERALQKRNEAFEESLGDMVRAHIDKKNSLVQDIADENSDFKESMDERTKDFKEKMNEMVADYKERVADIKQSQIDENDSFAESMQDKKDRFSEAMESMTERHDEKVKSLTQQLSKEKREGDETNRAKLFNLQQELEDENASFLKDKMKKEAENQKEITKFQIQHDKKVAAYKKELTDKEVAYNEAVAKQKTAEEEQTKKLQKEHDKRVAATQKQLDEEMVILNRHQAEVTIVSKQAVEDDITRLKKRYEKEKAESLQNHLEKLDDIKKQGKAEGAGYGGGLLDGLKPKIEELNKITSEAGRSMGDNLAGGIAKGTVKAAENLVGGFITNIKNQIGALPEYMQTIVLPKLGLGAENVKRYLGFKQAGGIVPGPIGQPVPIIAHGQEEVIPVGKGNGMVSGGGTTFNVYVGLYAGSEIEKRRIAEALYNQLVLVAGSQNKSVKDLFGR